MYKAIHVFRASTGFACRYSFFVYPELKELNYRGLKAEKPHRAVTESDIDRELDNFRRNHLRVYETEREARFGDSIRGEKNGILYRLVSGDYLRLRPEKILDGGPCAAEPPDYPLHSWRPCASV